MTLPSWFNTFLVLAIATSGCTTEKSQALRSGAGVSIDAGTVSIDQSEVPLVTGSCTPGQVVARTSQGWACAAPTGQAGPTGPMGVTGATGPTGSTGPAGTPCDTTRLSSLEAAVATMEARLSALEATQCPRGYNYDSSELPFVVCKRTLYGVTDVMVKVGDFWIDRYETSVCPASGAIGSGPGYDTTAAACSVAGATPEGDVTWFQASSLCANAGKTLCTNAEWQTAASGTTDPGPWPTASPGCNSPPSSTQCTTCAYSGGTAGQAVLCVSRFGANDMIGNFAEWVADWFQAGRGWADHAFSDGLWLASWPAGYAGGLDTVHNVYGRVNAGPGSGWVDGLPAAGVRGGGNFMFGANGTGVGAFHMDLSLAPSFYYPEITGRCCRRDR